MTVSWKESAFTYKDKIDKVSFIITPYKDLLLGIEKNDIENAADLGCGSNYIALEYLASKKTFKGFLNAVDSSEEMLKKLKDKFKNEQLVCINNKAEQFITEQKLDLIISINAFRHFNIDTIFENTHRNSKCGASFHYNLMESDLDNFTIENDTRYLAINLALSELKLPKKENAGQLKKINLYQMMSLAKSHNWSLENFAEVIYPTQKQDWVNYYSIDAIINQSFSYLNLQKDLSVNIINRAIEIMHYEVGFPSIKHYFISLKNKI